LLGLTAVERRRIDLRSVIKVMAVAIRLVKPRDEPSGDRIKTDHEDDWD
jgi:hypothetical protein